jgi:hypothetical protein
MDRIFKIDSYLSRNILNNNNISKNKNDNLTIYHNDQILKYQYNVNTDKFLKFLLNIISQNRGSFIYVHMNKDTEPFQKFLMLKFHHKNK